jgi:hypothetical protein
MTKKARQGEKPKVTFSSGRFLSIFTQHDILHGRTICEREGCSDMSNGFFQLLQTAFAEAGSIYLVTSS